MFGKRNRIISLNKAVSLTQGNPIRLGGLISFFTPDAPDYTAVLESDEGERLQFSQISHQPGGRSAHFTFLTSDELEKINNPFAMIDFLCYQAGELGALNVLADIEESHPLFENFRRAGFCVYGWETIYRIPKNLPVDPSGSRWEKPSPAEEVALRSLYQTLIPPLVQNAEPFSNGGTPRLVYKVNGELLAYVESVSGPAGIYLVPVIHPSVEDSLSLIVDLLCQFQGMGRPLYLQVRSYQAWLSESLEKLGAESMPRFSLLVKHLAVGQVNTVKNGHRAHADQRQAEPTAPMLNRYE